MVSYSDVASYKEVVLMLIICFFVSSFFFLALVWLFVVIF